MLTSRTDEEQLQRTINAHALGLVQPGIGARKTGAISMMSLGPGSAGDIVSPDWKCSHGQSGTRHRPPAT